MKQLFAFSLLFCLFFPVSLWAWGQKGHRIVAQVAYNNMSRKAIRKVDAVLGKHGMVYWANWADEIKSDTIYPETHNWHYYNMDEDFSDDDVLDEMIHPVSRRGNLWNALFCLGNNLEEYGCQRDCLAFYIHLVGDSFCPMHLGRKEDLGGNKVKMQWFGRNTNLHRVWDEHLIESQGYSYKEYAEYLEDKYGSEKDSILQAQDKQLILQTYHLTQEIYAYQDNFDGNTYHYIYRWHRDCELQLYRAGLRLAAYLNKLYK